MRIGGHCRRCLHDGAAAANGVHDSAASPRGGGSRSPLGVGAGRTPVCSGAESASLQRSFVSNSSLHSESGTSLVHNESLGLDERNIFENFNKLASRRRCVAFMPPRRYSASLGMLTFLAIVSRTGMVASYASGHHPHHQLEV